LPVGLQIVGPRFSEPRLLAIAKLVQEAQPLGFSALLDTLN
jgi:Asp-tRNA(Asn)/Glu-tRNA(Gln) amidotransferase A subunit family amidase